jgi:hypothetical protein
LTKSIDLLESIHGTGWEADDRQEYWAGAGDRIGLAHLKEEALLER